MSLIFLIALPVLMYFLLIRPQQRRAKEQRDLLSAVAEGDEVMTTGGIYGYVNAVEDDTIWLDIAEGVEIRIAKGAVAKRIPAAERPTCQADAAERRGDRAPMPWTRPTRPTTPTRWPIRPPTAPRPTPSPMLQRRRRPRQGPRPSARP